MKVTRWIFVLLLTAGCTLGTDDDKARQSAAAWADAYFNCDFMEAGQYVTDESMKWLRLAASNTTERDLELLRQRNATVSVDDYMPAANDTLRIVVLHVSNYLAATPLGEESRQSGEGVFQVCVVQRNGRWCVRMEGLPRSEKQSRD